MNAVQTMESNRRVFQPNCTIREENGKIRVLLEMPGVEKDDLSIHVEHHELTIEGKRPALVEEGRYLVRERRVGDFKKIFTIDDTIDADKIDAVLENGMVTLTIPLREAVQPRQIPIRQK